MLAYIPFLIGPLTYGVVALLTFMASVVVFTIPVFATRGRTQGMWLAVVAFALFVEAVLLVTLGILVDQGKIWN